MLLVGLTLAAAACGDSTTPSPLAPSIAGDTAPGAALKVTAPSAVAPGDGSQLDTRQPTLIVSNPTAPNAPAATLRLRFVVQDEGGTRLHDSGPLALGEGTTRYTLPNELEAGRTYRWYSEVSWNDTIGAASATRSFSTPSASTQAPVTGDNCQGGALEIVTCQRDRRSGFMGSAEFIVFLNATVRNLNANGIPGAPFGLLRKNVGHQCEGYSCDVICSGQGGGQLQWDIVHDIDGAQSPTWAGPHSGNIRVDSCEVP